jgi:hypothetical protein
MQRAHCTDWSFQKRSNSKLQRKCLLSWGTLFKTDKLIKVDLKFKPIVLTDCLKEIMAEPILKLSFQLYRHAEMHNNFLHRNRGLNVFWNDPISW